MATDCVRPIGSETAVPGKITPFLNGSSGNAELGNVAFVVFINNLLAFSTLAGGHFQPPAKPCQ
jgi:hypothetical protein